MTGRDSPIETGGMNDPVAQNIRREQQQNAMPSAEEMAGPDCDGCGEKGASPVMNPRYTPECPGAQQGGGLYGYYCDECAPEQETKEDVLDRHFREGDDFVVEYACGALLHIDKMLAFDGDHPPHPNWSPDVRLEHERCGSVIAEVHTREEWVDDE